MRADRLPGPPGTVPRLSFIDVLDGRFAALGARRGVVIGPPLPTRQDLQPTAVGGRRCRARRSRPTPSRPRWPDTRCASVAGHRGLLALGLALAVALSLCLRLRTGHAAGRSVALVGALVAAGVDGRTQLAFQAGAVVDFSAGVFAILASCMRSGRARGIAIGASGEGQRAASCSRITRPTSYAGSSSRTATPAGLARTEIIRGYRIEEVIGTGGMGVVYRAVELALDRTGRLKLIRPQHALRRCSAPASSARRGPPRPSRIPASCPSTRREDDGSCTSR